jgi:hypothetical protein
MDALERERLHRQGSVDETVWRQQTLPEVQISSFSFFWSTKRLRDSVRVSPSKVETGRIIGT